MSTTLDAQTFSIATHNGCITMYNPKTKKHRTVRIKTQPKTSKFRPGARIISLLSGSDNETNYTGFGFVNPNGKVYVWRNRRGSNGTPSTYERIARMVENIERFQEHGITYQLEGRCRACNKKLTDPVSIKTGIGPVCAGRTKAEDDEFKRKYLNNTPGMELDDRWA